MTSSSVQPQLSSRVALAWGPAHTRRQRQAGASPLAPRHSARTLAPYPPAQAWQQQERRERLEGCGRRGSPRRLGLAIGRQSLAQAPAGTSPGALSLLRASSSSSILLLRPPLASCILPTAEALQQANLHASLKERRQRLQQVRGWAAWLLCALCRCQSCCQWDALEAIASATLPQPLA